MRLTLLQLKNWKNFTEAQAHLHERVFVVGPNASGKSNFLDALRFLHDVAEPEGGLQRAVSTRGGLANIRALGAPKDAEVTISVVMEGPSTWTYALSIAEREGRAVVSRELVRRGGVLSVLSRPSPADKSDPLLLGQTHLEQVATNRQFRELREFLSAIHYLHIVPEFIRQRGRINSTTNDPYGSDFLERVAGAPDLHKRMGYLNAALRIAVPQLDGIEVDVSENVPHLRTRFRNWRPSAPAQDENQLSDGTLRLFAFLWSLLDGTGPLLLEEPELSLHPGVIQNLMSLCAVLLADSGRQLFVSTHSLDLLSEESIAPEEVLMLIPSKEGTEIRAASDDKDIRALLEGGLRIGDAVLPSTGPPNAFELPLAGRTS